MRDYQGSIEEATLLIRCVMALTDEGIGPAERGFDSSMDGEIIESAARLAWRKFWPYQLEEIGLEGVVPAGAVWAEASQSWRD